MSKALIRELTVTLRRYGRGTLPDDSDNVVVQFEIFASCTFFSSHAEGTSHAIRILRTFRTPRLDADSGRCLPPNRLN